MKDTLPFAFNANALAMGGLFTKPTRSILSSQGSVTLAPTGGSGSATVENFNYHDAIICDRITSEVSGDLDEDGVYRTTATVRLSRVRIFNVLSAALIEATVFSEHPSELVERARTGDDREDATDSKITFNASFVGLTIGGVPIDARINPDCVRGDGATYKGFRKFIEAQPQVKGMVPLSQSQTLRWSILDPKRPMNPLLDRPGQRVRRHGLFSVHVSGFGRIYLGEVLIKRGRRRLNMIRMELDQRVIADQAEVQVLDERQQVPIVSAMALRKDPPGVETDGGVFVPTGGSATFASVESNGADFLP